jgi:hypothetical protein
VKLALLLFASLPLLADQEPEGRAQFIAASVSYHGGAFADSVEGYRKTVALHHEVPFSKMMIARCLGLMGNLEEAMDALDEAAEFEYGGANLLRTDPEFASLRQHPRFPAILAKVISNVTAPCGPRDRRHQLDFWLGEWDVTDANGRAVGSERIETAEGGCLIRESFTGATAGTGQSVSYYDKLTGYWRQVWMDPGGLVQDYYGGLTDAGMVFQQVSYNGGQKTILAVTYSSQPDGTVRQLGQRSIDDGATWTTLSNLAFTRKSR